MTDHADTIRTPGELQAADDAAQSTAEFYERKLAEARAERQQAIDAQNLAESRVIEQRHELVKLQTRCEQAIDALRVALKRLENVDGNLALANYDAQVILSAALLSLGEQP